MEILIESTNVIKEKNNYYLSKIYHAEELVSERAWTELTNVGATVTCCSKLMLSDTMFAVGKLDGNLIEIERLERKGWTWG